MTENMKYCDEIRKQYPETISKNQFYKIAHISKATAQYLLQSGLVPYKDTGKKTHRYIIRTDDVIAYMIDREIRPGLYHASENWYVGRSHFIVSLAVYWNKLTELSPDDRAAYRKYLEDVMKSYDDLMTVDEVSEVVGYGKTAIQNWCKDKKIKGFKISGKLFIPKASLIDYFDTQSSFEIKRKTMKHILMIQNFFE